MAAYFMDSGALVKRYVQERGTRWVRNLSRRNAPSHIYLARITDVEVTAAVARHRKGKTLTAAKASSILSRFRKHIAGRYTVVEITLAVLKHAATLANAHALLALDAGQLAVAIEVNRPYQSSGACTVTLVSADQALNAFAAAERLVVEDPTTHSW